MRKLLLVLCVSVALGVGVAAQGSLSTQVLQLLTRTNTWTATNTFLDLRLIVGVPSDTALRFYVDASNNLYFNGVLVAGAGGGVTPHNLLSSTHTDTLAASPTRGSVVVANSTPAWAKVALCAAGSYLGSNGTDTTCLTSAAGFTAIPAGQITGTASAFSGAAITALNASNLGSGTVPLARLSGITTTQIDAAAAIPYSKLTLTGGILNADINAAAAIAYTKLALTGNIVNGDLTAGTLLFSRWASNSCTASQVPQYDGAAWGCRTLTSSDISGGGTVTSVALALPTLFTVSGSPVTTTGTLTGTLATQVKNLVWAGPASGADAAPTFRALVTGDLPIVAFAQGGTGLSVAADDTTLVSSGSAWVAATLPNCVYGLLAYTQSTNLFSCPSSLAASAAGTGTLGTTPLPFATLVVGTAATNNLSITPAAFAQGTVATVDDPALATVKLPLVRRGTIAYTSGSLSTGTCAAAVTATVTGLATTSMVAASLNTTPQTAWKTGITFHAYPTANTVNIMVCNPTGGTIVPESATFNYAAFVP